MSYGEKFSLSFTDVRGNNRKLSILKKNYTGSVLPLVGTGDPVVIKWDSNDDVFTPIIGSTCELNLYVTSSTNYDDWYDADEREYKVQISTGDVSGSPQWDTEETEFQSKNITWDDPLGTGFEFYWEGFLVVDQSKQLIMTEPSPIQIVASDQLGLLEGYTAPDSAITLDSSNEISMSSQSNFDTLFYLIKQILMVLA